MERDLPLLGLDELRAALFREGGVVVDRDDPVLQTALICDFALSRWQERVDSEARRLQDSFLLTVEGSEARARETAGRVISEAADYVDERLRVTVAEAVATARGELSQLVLQGRNAEECVRSEVRVVRQLVRQLQKLLWVQGVGCLIVLAWAVLKLGLPV